MSAQYQAALLNLQTQGRAFAAAFKGAAFAAQQFDPDGTKTPPEAEAVMRDLAIVLRATCVLVPGAREVFQLALQPQRPDPN